MITYKLKKHLKKFTITGILLFTFSFLGCGEDSSSSPDADSPSVKNSSSSIDDSENISSGISGTSANSATSASAGNSTSSSSKKTETLQSEEILNEAKMAINGTCGPNPEEISRGEIGTWKFYRTTGDVFDQIMAPFVWTFGNGKKLQGNGLQEVNVLYEESGTQTANLTVDGNTIECSPLQVQGEPITIDSCKANATNVKALETITWTVYASSNAKITSYEWSSSLGTIEGSNTTATLVAQSSMHKQTVSPTVVVRNEEETASRYSCEGVFVLDPNSVDLVLPLGDINSAQYGETQIPSLPDSVFLTPQTPMTVQIPNGASNNCIVGCKPKVGADYMSLKIYWGSDDPLTNFAYFTPAGCAPGVKYSVTASVAAVCVVK